MTADTYSSILGYLRQVTGNNNNSWGDNANDSVFQIIEDAIAGTLSTVLSGGTLSLNGTPPPAGPSATRFKTLIFTGSPGTDQIVVVPALKKTWNIVNNSDGDFVIKANGSTNTRCIPVGATVGLWCDGTDVHRMDRDSVGDYVDSAGASARPGAVECDGTYYKRDRLVDLFNEIGTTYGTTDSTNFRVPNFTDTGRYRRSRIVGTTDVGTYQSNQNLSHTHTGSVTSSGSGSTATESATHVHGYSGTTSGYSNDHNHVINSYQIGIGQLAGGVGLQGLNTGGSGFTTGGQSADHSHTYSGATATENAAHAHTFSVSVSGSFTSSASGGTEARPETAIVRTFIRY